MGICPNYNGQYRRRGLTRHSNRSTHSNNQNLTQDEDENNDANPANFIQDLFTSGFGAPLINSVGNADDECHIR